MHLDLPAPCSAAIGEKGCEAWGSTEMTPPGRAPWRCHFCASPSFATLLPNRRAAWGWKIQVHGGEDKPTAGPAPSSRRPECVRLPASSGRAAFISQAKAASPLRSAAALHMPVSYTHLRAHE